MSANAKYRVLVAISILWVAGMLIPLENLGRYSRVYRTAFVYVFGAEWVHVLFHATLFAVLTYLLMLVLPATRFRIIIALLLVAGVALGQEYAQLWSRGRDLGAPERFDLMVDAIGAIIGLGAAQLRQYLHKPLGY